MCVNAILGGLTIVCACIAVSAQQGNLVECFIIRERIMDQVIRAHGLHSPEARSRTEGLVLACNTMGMSVLEGFLFCLILFFNTQPLYC